MALCRQLFVEEVFSQKIIHHHIGTGNEEVIGHQCKSSKQYAPGDIGPQETLKG
ncbi:hypothetical protein D3C86_1105260 [compost metagenome]